MNLIVDIHKEIYCANDFHIYSGMIKDTYEEVTVKTNGFELCNGTKKLVGSMGTYKGQKSFICQYEEFDGQSKEAQKNLLMSINGIKESKAELIIRNVDDINVFREDDYPKIKGIGPGTVLLIRVGLQLLDTMKIFKEMNILLGNSCTPKVIKEITEIVETLDGGMDTFKDKPWMVLIDHAGMGFMKADKIALKMGAKIDSKERQCYLIEYVVKQYTRTGNCYITLDKLKETLEEQRIRYDEDSIINNHRLVIDDERIYTCSMFESETLIPRMLHEFEKKETDIKLLDTYEVEDYIKDFERLNKIKFDEYQKQAIEISVNNPVSIITGGAGCVDCDTEFFNGTEWKKISKYQEGEKVLQYNKNGIANLVIPLEYHKYEADLLWNFKTKYGIDQCLSDEHNVYYITSKNNLYCKQFSLVRENHEKTSFKGKFITTFEYHGEGIEYSEFEIRLKIAIKADGNYPKKSDYCVINLKKERKKARIRMLLNRNNIQYKEKNTDNGYTRFSFNHRTMKTFGSNWYNCSKQQFEIIYDEIFYWDGDFVNKKCWTSTIKEDADFIQFIGTTCGYRTYISINDRVGETYFTCGNEYERKSVEYTVIFSRHKLVSLCRDKREDHIKTPILKYKTKDGFKYCFTTGSGILILRRNNNIFITGNSGKTTLLKCVNFILETINYRLFLTAPTGKAARRMSQACGYEATTIHRFLNDSMDLRTYKNSVMIVDESSMIDTELFFELLSAMDRSSVDFKKIILVGDPGQLPSVQPGNVLNDLITSEKLPTIKLTKTFRQAGDSNIIDIATNVRHNETFDFMKKKDFYVKEIINAKEYKESIKYFFNYLRDKYNDLDSFYSEVQFITPIKKGDIGVNAINEMIKNEVNPKQDKKSWFPFDLNDKVMCVKNDRENGIFNGEFGRIHYVDNTTFTIYYRDLEKYVTYKKEFDIVQDFILSYCSTVHKLQGSEFKFVVIILAQDSFICDSRLLYTAITRGKETVIMLTNKAITDKIIPRNNLLKRNTHLKERIEAEYDMKGGEEDVEFR